MHTSATTYMFAGLAYSDSSSNSPNLTRNKTPKRHSQSGVGGVVLGGTAIFSALNGYTPHMAGAIDIMVVEQPDGSLKCSPFYGARISSLSLSQSWWALCVHVCP